MIPVISGCWELNIMFKSQGFLMSSIVKEKETARDVAFNFSVKIKLRRLGAAQRSASSGVI